MQNIRYRNFILEPSSYRLALSKKWVPKLMLSEDRLSEVKNSPLTWNKEFQTKEEADTFAIKQAKLFVDRQN